MTEQQYTEAKHIHLLPEHLIDQIKAGEVIERPSSLLKELVENSLDANSKKIDIHIRENGLELISIEDDGDGIEYPDLPYAFCRHATSKIERFEDLYALNSFGFRGEALASISSTSRLTCVSTPKKDLEHGGKIIIHGGEQKTLVPHKTTTSGTSIFVKDLFFNTPARLKFVKSKISEKNSLKRTLNSFLLSNPQTTFSIKWDDKEKDFYPAVDLKKRISQLFFKKNAENKDLIEFEKEYEGHHVKGYVTKASSRGNAGRSHYLFANNRLFIDRQTHMSIMRSMERYWPQAEIGDYCLKITVPADKIDVNVHPNKTQVKFFKPSIVFSLVTSAIKESLVTEAPLKTREDIPFYNGEHRDLQASQVLDRLTNNPFQNYAAGKPSSDLSEQITSEWSYFPINSQFSLLKSLNSVEQNSYLIHTPKLLGFYIWNQIQLMGEIQEINTTPLLISEPFPISQSKIDQYLPGLKNMGLELDRLDEKIIVLRSIPTYLTFLPIQGVVQIILSQLEKLSLENLPLSDVLQKVLLELDWELDFKLTSNQVDKIREHFEMQELLNKGIILEMNNTRLQKLMRDS